MPFIMPNEYRGPKLKVADLSGKATVITVDFWGVYTRVTRGCSMRCGKSCCQFLNAKFFSGWNVDPFSARSCSRWWLLLFFLFMPVLILYLYVICSWSSVFSCSLNARWLSSLVPPGALARWIWERGLSVIRRADVTWSPGMCRCFGETGHSSEG